MKNHQKYIIGFFILLTSIPSLAQGHKKLKKVLKKEMGVYAYRSANDEMGPGTIIRIKKIGGQPTETVSSFAENLIQNSDIKISKTPVAKINSSSDLKFTLQDSLNTKDKYGQPIKSVAWLSFQPKSSYQISVDSAKIHLVDDLILRANIIKNKDDFNFMTSLMQRKSLLVARTIEFYGFSFSFKRQSEVDAKLAIKMQKKALKNDLTLTFSDKDSSQFKISSKDPLFYGYVPFKENQEQIRQFIEDYEEHERLKQQKAQEERVVSDLNSVNLSASSSELRSTLVQLYSRWRSYLPDLPVIPVVGGEAIRQITSYDNDVILDLAKQVQSAHQTLLEEQAATSERISSLESKEYEIFNGLMPLNELDKFYED